MHLVRFSILLVTLLAACGQAGPLYLPEGSPAPTASPVATVAPTATAQP